MNICTIQKLIDEKKKELQQLEKMLQLFEKLDERNRLLCDSESKLNKCEYCNCWKNDLVFEKY